VGKTLVFIDTRPAPKNANIFYVKKNIKNTIVCVLDQKIEKVVYV
jgi:hypothetical protein